MNLSRRRLRIIVRNVLVVAAARFLLGILKSLVKRSARLPLHGLLMHELISWNPWKWGCVVGGVSCFPLIRDLLGTVCRSRNVVAFVSGIISALPVLVMNNATRTELALYALVRALHSFVSTHVMPRLPPRLRDFSHYDTISMMASAAEILYSAMFQPRSHPPGYIKFIIACTITDRRLINGTAGVHRRQIVPELIDFLSERGAAIPEASEHSQYLCHHYHPGVSCDVNTPLYILRHLRRFSLPLYLPLKVTSYAGFHSRELIRDPLGSSLEIAKSTVQSSLFLSVYAAVAVRAICFCSQHDIRRGWLLALLVGFSSGLATLIESKKRRLDLALYCSMQAIRSLTLKLYLRGYINKPSSRFILLVYLFSVGYLIAEYDASSEEVHPTIKRFFGVLIPQKSGRAE
jgi:hypothetical protein